MARNSLDFDYSDKTIQEFVLYKTNKLLPKLSDSFFVILACPESFPFKKDSRQAGMTLVE
jgi:hypothetical protein